MLDNSEYKTFLGIWENSYKTSVLLEKILLELKQINLKLEESVMKKLVSFIPAILWLILSILRFVEGNVEKGIVFMVCAVGWAVVEIIFIKWQKNK